MQIALLGRLYCVERALWMLSCFLRDFGYVSELLKPGSGCSDCPDKEATNVF
jgi:hypothetical protein